MKNEVIGQEKRPHDMKQGFRPVLKITITKRNLASWSKPIKQQFQEGSVQKGIT
jgi:hypothetical protein